MKECKNNLHVPEIKEISKRENISEEQVRRLVASGKAVILRNNQLRDTKRPIAIGAGLSVKVNINIGTSPGYSSVSEELAKASVAVKYGADTLMDLSTGTDINQLRQALIKQFDIPLGTVPIYQAAKDKALKGNVIELTEDEMFSAVEQHLRDGVSFLTIHSGITKETVQTALKSNRIGGVVSRGGAILTAWIYSNDCENPYYANFDYLLELLAEYDATLSIGDGLRPGCINDATDRAQIHELLIISELVERARAQNVQTIVEGPGHMPFNQIAANIKLQKAITHDAPFYVLGPLVTDIAPGYDHIVAAIGGTVAAVAGADFLCAVTPSEHLGLPTLDDIREGVVASKIAAHAANITRNIGKDQDDAISKARVKRDWEQIFQLAIDPDKARTIYNARKYTNAEVCSMCGDLCALKLTETLFHQQ